MIRNLKIWQKLALLAFAFSIPIAVLLYLLVAEKNIAINFAEKEKMGTVYHRPLRKLLEAVPQHARAAAGSEGASDSASRADTAIRELEGLDQQLRSELKAGEKFNALKGKWLELKSKEAAASPDERRQLHADVVAGIRGLIAHVGDTSNLILDPDLDSYYVMDAELIKLPESQDLIAQTLQYGKEITKTGAIVGYEQPLHSKVSFVADWFSGKNRFGYVTPGFAFTVSKRSLFYAGYSIGNQGRKNNGLFLYYGITF